MPSDEAAELAEAAADTLMDLLTGDEWYSRWSAIVESAVDLAVPAQDGVTAGTRLRWLRRAFETADASLAVHLRSQARQQWRSAFEEALRLDLQAFAKLSALFTGPAPAGHGSAPAAEPWKTPRRQANVPIQLNVFPSAVPPATATPAVPVPGALPSVWNIPPRNPSFTGREHLLDNLYRQLHSSQRVVVQALRGWGGVGKTQLATEFAHRHASDYLLAWWIDAEQSRLIAEQYADLAIALDLVETGVDTPAAVRAARSYLRNTNKWLVILDNAESPYSVADWLPQGPGQVIITSRHQRWVNLANPLDVDVLSREESIELMQKVVPGLPRDDADSLAETLGDLPLALVQAAGYLTETGCGPRDYADSVKHRAQTVLVSGARRATHARW